MYRQNIRDVPTKNHGTKQTLVSSHDFNSCTFDGRIRLLNKGIKKCYMEPSVPCGRSLDHTITIDV